MPVIQREYKAEDYPESKQEEAQQLFVQLKTKTDQAYDFCLRAEGKPTMTFQHNNKLPDKVFSENLTSEASARYNDIVKEHKDIIKRISSLKVKAPSKQKCKGGVTKQRTSFVQDEGASYSGAGNSFMNSVVEATRSLISVEIRKTEDTNQLQNKANMISDAFRTIDRASVTNAVSESLLEEYAELAQARFSEIKEYAKELEVEIVINRGAEEAIFGTLC